ncbi:MAG: S1/P1 nuclease [Alistipes sp.]|nr:S1/P1 nuclease [Alistipes sp.]
MKRFLTLLCTLCFSLTAFGWGQKGHDVVAYIAECNLSPKAYARVVALLDDHSPVYYANWMDNASHTREYRYTKTWHYANVDEGHTFESMPRNEKGDVVKAIEDIVAALKSGSLTEQQEKLQLRFLIHLVGDIHSPMHAGRLSDLGGNKVPLSFFGKKTNLHSLWDTALVEAAHKWSYTEWQQQLDRHCPPQRKAQIAQGTPTEWFKQSHEIAKGVYLASQPKAKLSYWYLNYYTPIVEEQLLCGGLRLARLLNEIYGD